MLSNPQPKLTFGALNLIGTKAEITANGYCFEAIGDDTDWGDPVPVTEKVLSWLQDGAIVALKNYDNRELNVRVRVVGADLNKLAIGESALMLETGKPNLLTWTPPDGVGAPSVFSVVTSSLEFAFDDLNENRITRMYALKIVAEPFVRSQNMVTVVKPAPTGTQAITAIDTGASATNWTQTVQPAGSSATTSAASAAGGFVKGQALGISQTLATRLTLTRSAIATNISTTPYIRIIASANFSATTWANGTTAMSFKLNGTDYPVAIQSGRTYWFDASAITTLSTVEITAYVIGYPSSYQPQDFNITVDDISRSNVIGDVGTKKQLLRTVTVAGSARAQANLAVEDASAALGTTMVYTYPTAAGIVAPPLRPFASGGGTTTADATAVFGSNTLIDSVIRFRVPVYGLVPGGYLLVARLKHPSVGARTVTWDVMPRIGTTTMGSSFIFGVLPFTSDTGWQTLPIATMTLPNRKLGNAGEMQISLQGSSGVLIDEAWLFNLDTGQLTWVECGVTSPAPALASNRLWLDAPSIGSPSPAVYVGFAADRTDSYHAGPTTADGGMYSFAVHEFVPPATNVFTVTTNSTASAVTLSHFPRWHTHAVT